MNFSPLTLYVLAAIFQTAGSSGAAMLAPFFMKAHGYSVAAAGVPLVANGVGRVCSDVLSGVMATYFSAGAILFAAMIIGIATSIAGYLFMGVMPVFVGAWIIFGLTEAMFALSLRKIGFDQSPPDRQGRVQGQMASALGIGFSIGPLFGGLVGKWLGPDGLFFLYAAPQFVGLIIVFIAGAHHYRQKDHSVKPNILREGRRLLGKIPFLASCLAICQSFLFLVGVTRVAFPFLAVNLRGLGLESVGLMVSISRLTDTAGRYIGGRLCDRIRPAMVILLGVAIGVPMFLLQPLGSSWIALMLPLAITTMGFGFTNVGATTFALQSADPGAKELSLGISRASTSVGQAIGPLICGGLVEQMGYEGGFQAMALISAVIFVMTWVGLRQQTRSDM